MTAATFTTILSGLTVITHIFFILLAASYLPVHPIKRFHTWLTTLLKRYGQLAATVVASIATITPLIYTHIYHFTPCTLCWFQRIFLFPIAILLIISQVRNRAVDKVPIYVLSAFGIFTSLFHYAGQRLHNTSPDLFKSIGCDALGMSASCSEYYFLAYDYITIPLMAFSAFVCIVIAIFFSNRA